MCLQRWWEFPLILAGIENTVILQALNDAEVNSFLLSHSADGISKELAQISLYAALWECYLD